MEPMNIPTSTWTAITPEVEVWHNHGRAMPLDRIGDGPGTVRIRLVGTPDPTQDRTGAAASPITIQETGWYEWREGDFVQVEPSTCLLCAGNPKQSAYTAKEWLAIKACPKHHRNIFKPSGTPPRA